MHENRIAGLQKRLRNLATKLANGWPESAIAPDRERTEAELALLTGIKRRNDALADEAPAIGRKSDAAAERRRSIRDRDRRRERRRRAWQRH